MYNLLDNLEVRLMESNRNVEVELKLYDYLPYDKGGILN